MDPASRLFCLRQGNQPIEDYVADFCELCHLVTFNDVALKDIFRHRLNDPIRSGLPGGKIHWSLEQYIDYVLLLAVGIADKEPCNPSAPITSEHFHTPTFMSGIVYIMPEPSHAKPAKPKLAQVMSTKPQPAHVASSAPGPAHAMPARPESAPVMAAIPEPVHKMTAIPKPVHKMAAIPKPVHKMAAPSESPAKMGATPKPHHAKIISSETHPIISAVPKAIK
ncbi:Filamentous hemagglutinin [Labeo rohita]|uniref:Filamentous hemagglutinin n=1 Tax=Labeo rohita TaxID=84645 RepID=A0ABQ8LBU3_LABRO|nr:Filamentous hemagglutinin [Labeo rohita]